MSDREGKCPPTLNFESSYGPVLYRETVVHDVVQIRASTIMMVQFSTFRNFYSLYAISPKQITFTVSAFVKAKTFISYRPVS